MRVRVRVRVRVRFRVRVRVRVADARRDGHLVGKAGGVMLEDDVEHL